MSRCFVALLTVALSLAYGSLHASAEPRKLRLSLQLPITNHIGVNVAAFKERVERATDGALTFDIIDSGRAFDDQKIGPAVAEGQIEMGVINTTNLAKAVPAIDIFQQPFLFNFDALVRAATDPERPIRKLIDSAVLQATGIKLLWWQSYGSTVLFSKGRDAIMPSEIKDRPVRTFGMTASEFIRYCGGKPAMIPATKQQEALKTGQVDFVMTGITGVDGRKLWEVSDTVTRTELAAIEFAVGINGKVWDSLSPAHRDVMLKAAAEVERELRDQIQTIEAKAYEFARAKGMRILELDPVQVAEWRACSAPVMEAFMTETGELGRQLMTIYGELRKDPCCSGGTSAGFMRY